MLVKVDVSVTLTSHRLPYHLPKPAVLCNGYNLALTRKPLSLMALRKVIMGPGVKMF